MIPPWGFLNIKIKVEGWDEVIKINIRGDFLNDVM